MKRGEIWTIRAPGNYLEKPRPAVIMQVRKISESESVVVCLFTSYVNTELSTRVKVLPSEQNGLSKETLINACFMAIESIQPVLLTQF